MFESINPSEISLPVSDYSMGVKVPMGDLIFIAGQVPLDGDGQLVGKGDIYAQMRQIFKNIKAVVEKAGAKIENIVKLNVYLTDRAYLQAFREVRREFFNEPYPAATGVIVQGLALEDWLAEIEGIAVLPKRI
jgi:reactive intermediate/imine deaminase